MALDEPKESDNSYDVNGFKFIMDKEFDKKAGPVSIDYMGYGFKINSNIEFGPSCSSCGTTGSCCS